MSVYYFRGILLIILGILFLRAALSSRRGKFLSAREIGAVRKNLSSMNDRTFEFFCGELFRELGYKNVVVTAKSRDGGKDIVCKDSKGKKCYIECKKYSGSVSSTVANRLYGISMADNVFNSKLISTGRFTEDCLKFCRKVGIECIDFDRIMDLVKKYGKTSLLKYK